MSLACWFRSRAARIVFVDSTTLRCEAAPAGADKPAGARVAERRRAAASGAARAVRHRPPRTDGGGGDLRRHPRRGECLGAPHQLRGRPPARVRAARSRRRRLTHTVVPARFVSNREAVRSAMDSPVTLLLRIRRAVGASGGAGRDPRARHAASRRRSPSAGATLRRRRAGARVPVSVRRGARRRHLRLVDRDPLRAPRQVFGRRGYRCSARPLTPSRTTASVGDAWARFVYAGGCVPEATTSVAASSSLRRALTLLYQDHARRQQLLRAPRARAPAAPPGGGAPRRRRRQAAPEQQGFGDGADEAEGRSLLKVGAPPDQLRHAAFPEPPSMVTAAAAAPGLRRRSRALSASGPVLARRAGPLISAGGGGAGRRADQQLVRVAVVGVARHRRRREAEAEERPRPPSPRIVG